MSREEGTSALNNAYIFALWVLPWESVKVNKEPSSALVCALVLSEHSQKEHWWHLIGVDQYIQFIYLESIVHVKRVILRTHISCCALLLTSCLSDFVPTGWADRSHLLPWTHSIVSGDMHDYYTIYSQWDHCLLSTVHLRVANGTVNKPTMILLSVLCSSCIHPCFSTTKGW